MRLIPSKFIDLLGKTITKIEDDSDEVIFYTEDQIYRLYHEVYCCEHVFIDEITGDLGDLIGCPILRISEEGKVNPKAGLDLYKGDMSWTFHKLTTIKGSVSIEWLKYSFCDQGIRRDGNDILNICFEREKIEKNPEQN